MHVKQLYMANLFDYVWYFDVNLPQIMTMYNVLYMFFIYVLSKLTNATCPVFLMLWDPKYCLHFLTVCTMEWEGKSKIDRFKKQDQTRL